MEYELIRSARRTIGAEIKNGRLVVRAPYLAGKRDIERFLDSQSGRIEKALERARAREEKKAAVAKLTPEEVRALAAEARRVVPERCAFFAPLVGVKYGRITIRTQRSRWGSCSSKGNLNFNCLLMKAPPEVLDGVVVHELCHIKEMNHSARFYAEVTRVLPDYKKRRKWLDDNGDLLMAMLENDGKN
ncbi:MAG: M48 family metallopeptidase [Oscillospiraceae bacterium]|nr:M48 family metallopeptidase [Oscillospiraceae bacterium]